MQLLSLQLLIQNSKPKAKRGLLNGAEKQKWYLSSLPTLNHNSWGEEKCKCGSVYYLQSNSYDFD